MFKPLFAILSAFLNVSTHSSLIYQSLSNVIIFNELSRNCQEKPKKDRWKPIYYDTYLQCNATDLVS
jgi:hypothetical protein